MRYTLDNGTGTCDIQYENNGSVNVVGMVSNAPQNAMIVFWAANPPDYRTAFSGSGLPYPNYNTAYQNTPNQGVVPLSSSGQFSFNIKYPSAYYAGLGSAYVKPHINIQINAPNHVGKVNVISLGDGVPYRLLTYPPPPEMAPRDNAMFYWGREQQPVRTQEQILRDSAYPDTLQMASNFWGLRPPN